MNMHQFVDEELVAISPSIHMPMLQTAEIVANRYNISREAMDEYGLSPRIAPRLPMQQEGTVMNWYRSPAIVW